MRFLITMIAVTATLLAAPMDQEEQRLGFVALSDGKTFDGWKHPGNWEIQDGAFARVRPSGQLTYEARPLPDDFELRFDWKVSKGCNSGVYYRPGQVEYQVLDDVGSPYGENPRQSAASLFFCMAPSKRVARPVGEWNTARIRCQGTVIEHWLNEQNVLSFDYADPKWTSKDAAASCSCRTTAKTSPSVTSASGRLRPAKSSSRTRRSSPWRSRRARLRRKKPACAPCFLRRSEPPPLYIYENPDLYPRLALGPHLRGR